MNKYKSMKLIYSARQYSLCRQFNICNRCVYWPKCNVHWLFFSLFSWKKNNNTTTATQNKLQCYTLQCANRHVETHRLWCKKQVYSCSFTVSTFLFSSSLLLSFNSLCYDLLVDFLSFMWFFHYFDISIAHATILTFMQVFVDWKKMNLAWYCDCQSIIQLMGFNSVNSIILRFIEWRKCWNIVHRVQFNI